MSNEERWWHNPPAFSYVDFKDELASMSTEERLSVIRDVHGTDPEIEETQEFIRGKLEQLEETLDAFDGEKEAYELALFVNQTYVQSDEFRIMFLRADRFDAEAAARRMVNYWERKVDLFGTENAFRKLNFLLDFKKEDDVAVRSGGCRLLPHADEAGRAIVFLYRKYYDPRPERKDSMVRLLWHIAHAAIEDPEYGEDVQKGGIVCLIANGMALKSLPLTWFRYQNELNRVHLADCQEALPVRIVAGHQFLPNMWVKRFVEQNLIILGGHFRTRLQLYEGNANGGNAVLLEKCGIMPSMIPNELGGELNFNYDLWIIRKYAEDIDLWKDLSARSM